MSRLTPSTWNDVASEDATLPGAMGWLRVLRRGIPLGLLTFGCLGVLLLVRVIERPLFGLRRPWTPYVTQFVCRSAFRCLGMRHRVHGTPAHRGAVVANHSSWLDIFALNARQQIYFVSKAEVAGWPGIGWLARATGTVFIKRRASEARVQKEVFEDRLAAGHLLLFFPEGTSTDGRRVLDFKSTLFAAFFADHGDAETRLQPVTVVYRAPEGASERFYGWWGDMEFGPHLIKTLAARRNGSVDVWYHEPLRVGDFKDRKSLAFEAGRIVREKLNAEIG